MSGLIQFTITNSGLILIHGLPRLSASARDLRNMVLQNSYILSQTKPGDKFTLLLCFLMYAASLFSNFQINFAFWSPLFSFFSIILCAICRKHNSMHRKYNLSIDALTVISYNADKAYSFYKSGIKDCIFILSYMHLPVGQKASLLIFRKSMLYYFTLFHNSRQGLFRMLMDVQIFDWRMAFGFSDGFCTQRRNRG